MTDQERQELRRRLAKRVMGWTDGTSILIFNDGTKHSTPIWLESQIYVKDFTPDLPTREGFYQCFGPGGLVETMKKEKLLALSLDDVMGEGWAASFKFPTGKTYLPTELYPNVCEAICVAADKAMEGK